MLSDDQRKRYARQIALAEIGQQGQAALLESSVLVIGAGGLGCPILQILVGAGIGAIGVVDHDYIDLSNLHRQFIYREDDVGRLKASVVVENLKKLNSTIQLTAHCEKLGAANAEVLFQNYDLIIDGSDNFETRFLVNAICLKQSKPLFTAAVSEWLGQVSVFSGHEKNEPCYRCFCPNEPLTSGRVDCSVAGVTGALTSVVASILANQVLTYLTQSGDILKSKLLRYDARSQLFKLSHITKDPHCQHCNKSAV